MQYITAGESHGPFLTGIVSDIPAGLSISEKNIILIFRGAKAVMVAVVDKLLKRHGPYYLRGSLRKNAGNPHCFTD